MYNNGKLLLFLEKYKEWQELVPQLISGNIEKLTAVVDAHHRKEKMMASVRSRYISMLFHPPQIIFQNYFPPPPSSLLLVRTM